MGILKDTDVINAIFIDLKSGCLQFNLTSSQWSHILVHCYDFILHAVAHIASLPWKISLVLYSSTGWQLTMSHGCCKVHRCLLKVCKNQYRHNYVMGQNHPGFLFRTLQTCVLRIFSHETSAFPIGCTSEHICSWCIILDHVITKHVEGDMFLIWLHWRLDNGSIALYYISLLSGLGIIA